MSNSLVRPIFGFMLLASATQAMSYDMDVHYYVTSQILLHVNSYAPLSENQLLVARGNQYTDDDMDVTGPSMDVSTSAVLQRYKWHFPGNFGGPGSYGPTIRNSKYAKHLINNALESNDPYRLGMALHTYLDSFAHEGYGADIGHLSAGHDPDRPHLNPDKFLEATIMMSKIINQWYANNGVKAANNPIDLTLFEQTARFVPFTWQCSGITGYQDKKYKSLCNGYTYDNEIIERSDNWYNKLKLRSRGVPLYNKLSGSEIQPWRLAATRHGLPSDGIYKTVEWLAKDWAGQNFGAPPMAMNKVLEAKNTGTLQSANIQSSGDESAIARDVLLNPDNYKTGYPKELASAKGVRHLISAAHDLENGWAGLILLGGAPHNYWNWAPMWKYIKPYINSKEMGLSLFALAVASDVGAVDKKICASINKNLKRYDPSQHSAEENKIFLEVIPMKSDYIAACATESINAIIKLEGDLMLQPRVASGLSLIASDEITNPKMAKQTAVAKVRNKAYNTLKIMRSGVKSNSAKSVFLSAHAAAKNVDLWFALAEQDPDDNVSHSPADTQRLNELESLLRSAISEKDSELMSTICSAIATYDKRDLDDDTLVKLLKGVLINPEFSSDVDEISYAIERLTQ